MQAGKPVANPIAKVYMSILIYFCLAGDILKLQVSFVQIQFVLHHITGEIQILQIIIVDIAGCHSTAHIDIGVGKIIDKGIFLQIVGECYAALLGRKSIKNGP